MSNSRCTGCKYEHKGWTPSCSKCLDAESDDYIGYEKKSKKKTYADRIRSMSDEELAELLYETETQYLPIGLHVENGWPECLKKEVDND